MGIFSPRRPPVDQRPRELRVHQVPVIAADHLIVCVDMVVRFDPQPSRDLGPAGLPGVVSEPSWHGDDDVVVRAVVLTALRMRGEDADSATMLSDRAGTAALVERMLRWAPGPSSYDVRITRLEVARGGITSDPDIRVEVVS